MTSTPSEERKMLPCPFCGSADCRVIGGPGTRGGPQYWAGCDHCSGRAWGDTEAEAIAAWNRRPTSSRSSVLEEAARKLELSSSQIRLMAGEMTAGEMRTVCAVLRVLNARIRALAEEERP